jgi:hypothetical protein
MPGAGGIAAIGIGTSLAAGFLGGGGDAASEAAAAQAAAKQQAIATLQKNLSPFVEAGTGALPGLQQASTLGGIDQRLGDIFGGGTFRNLVDERTRAVENRNAAGGNFRSGQGLLDAARVPTDIGFQIEQLGQGRLSQLSGIGLNAAGNLGGGVANLQAGIGRDIGSGILGQAQGDAAQIQNAINTGVGVAGLFAPTAGAPLQAGAQGAQFTQQPGGVGPGPVAAIGTGGAAQVAINQLFGGF